MKNLLRFEELFFFILSIFLFTKTGVVWWWFPVLLFVPDVGMIGYLINPKLGAIIYNFVHHRAIAILLYITGSITGVTLILLAGIILLAHSSLDRVFDYGLKFSDRFKHTHLNED